MCHAINGATNGVLVDMSREKKCFTCFKRTLTSPFIGPCDWHKQKCAMPTSPTETCTRCNVSLVHRLCVPPQSEGWLLCPSCFQSASSNSTAAPERVAASPLEDAAAAPAPAAPAVEPPAAADAASTAPDSESSAPKKKKNRGGRPKGSTDAEKEGYKIRVKEARNYVTLEYADEQDKNNGTAPVGTRRRLVDDAIKKFDLKPDFDVPLSTIKSRIQKGNLVVWNTGTQSLVLEVEVMLNALIVSAWECNYPLTVGECMQVANNLIEGTRYAAEVIQWKKDRDCYDSEQPLLGVGWWRGFRKNLHAYEHRIALTLRSRRCSRRSRRA